MVNDKSWLSSASKFEKIFWGTILFFLFIFILLHFFASREFYQTKQEHKKSSKTIFKEIELVVNSNQMVHNMEDNETKRIIEDDLNRHIADINSTISNETSELFKVAYNNLDSFLDFHYSVIGEYVELGSMAVGKIEEHIQNRLFGLDFDIEMREALDNISENYQKNLKEHLKVMQNRANIGIDSSLNAKAIEHLQDDIHQHFLLQQGKLATIIVATVASKIVKVVATKLATKQATVIASKASTKAGMKTLATLSGASAGVICGPLVWICSPVAAATLWFGTDAIVVSIDENVNRESFKKEIISALQEQESRLRTNLKRHYKDAIIEFSNRARERYKKLPINRKKKIKIREIISQ